MSGELLGLMVEREAGQLVRAGDPEPWDVLTNPDDTEAGGWEIEEELGPAVFELAPGVQLAGELVRMAAPIGGGWFFGTFLRYEAGRIPEEAWRAAGGAFCPSCGSNSVSDQDQEHEGRTVRVWMACASCGETYAARYELAGCEL